MPNHSLKAYPQRDFFFNYYVTNFTTIVATLAESTHWKVLSTWSKEERLKLPITIHFTVNTEFILNNERLPFVWKTRKFRGEFKWNGSSRWKFSGKKVIPFQVLPFSLFYRNDRNFLYHLFGLLVPGFMSRESEKFRGIL